VVFLLLFSLLFAAPGWAQQLFTDYFACDVNSACVVFSQQCEELGPKAVNREPDYTPIVAGLAVKSGKTGASRRAE